jgi:Sulfotransferase domain
MGGALPNLVIIGSQKCGTTSLHSYLARHPEISMSSPKELDFFVAEHNWPRGVEWYREHFDPEARVRGESSPNYTADPYFAGVPERMAELIPDARLIFMVRDPVERVRANWIHTYSNRVEDRPLSEAVLDADAEYVARSRYHYQLTRFLEHYPRERILVVDQEELLRKRRPTLKEVWRFLGVRENVWRESFRVKRLQSSSRRRKTWLGYVVSQRVSHRTWRRLRERYPFSKPFDQTGLDERTRDTLEEMLREDARRLRERTGKPFEHWSV